MEGRFFATLRVLDSALRIMFWEGFVATAAGKGLGIDYGKAFYERVPEVYSQWHIDTLY